MGETADLIYSRLVADEKLKNGTAYERLAAIVFCLLFETTTIHDFRLVGKSGARHQIDVLVGDGEARSRALIECKDFERRVQLPQVRNFFGVVADTKPDEAFMVTTAGYSKGAADFAAEHGIRLAILRPPDGDEDWANVIRRVRTEIRATMMGEPDITLYEYEEEGAEGSPSSDVSDRRTVSTAEAAVVDADGTETPLQSYIEMAYGKSSLGSNDVFEHEEKFNTPHWFALDGETQMRIRGIKCVVPVFTVIESFESGEGIGGLVAELVLRTLDGEIHRMFTNRQIAEWQVSDGQVSPVQVL